MMMKDREKKREQIQYVCMEDLVPKDHILRDIDKAIDFSFIYELVAEKYCLDNGRPSIDPVILIKLPLIQYMFGIRSMRQTIKEIQVNNAYRWFLGLDLYDEVPHFTTFGKNYTRRFKGTDLFEQIFGKVLAECIESGFVELDTAYIDATHIKASANKKKTVTVQVEKEVLSYEQELKAEIEKDREEHGKKPLKDKDDDDKTPPTKTISQSTTDPDSGMFHKGEHKKDFAYVTQTACDKHGWILGYDLHPGNLHDSRTFYGIYEKLKAFNPSFIVADAGYKAPHICRQIIEDGRTPILPYVRPKTKDGFFKKHDYAYDEYFDCYICPNNQILKYSTTNRDGYKEYKSDKKICKSCPHLKQCTGSKDHVKLVTRHVWEEYLETVHDIRHTEGMKAIYDKRKETIERVFGDAKEKHGMRYTNLRGKTQVSMAVGLIFTCINLKKLAKWKKKTGLLNPIFSHIYNFSAV